MTANETRNSFISFFKSKDHQVVPSASMIVKNDSTLMFTNAGMNQFKDIFLGNSPATNKRIVNSQKCLRVSGKHNDLEEVGHDTYHHTMFEMLGNWSFGDYFKKEAISWAWEYLTNVLKINKEILYSTYFEGNTEEKLEADHEAYEIWKSFLPDNQVIKGSKKDNFWEMGNTGPCGPCSEIHIDLRNEDERKKIPGESLVNKNHPKVIEIWNLVFIQYNRKASGDLELLPNKHVDTGLGFERLCMVLQKKLSNYDTDVFQPVIKSLAALSGINYGLVEKADIAMRVVADHLRAVSFSIADGQLPSNNKAGYVIRRILRRAVRYGFTFLNQKEPFIYKLVPILSRNMGNAYPELITQQDLITNVIKEEESAFLRTLENGIKLVDQLMIKAKSSNKSEIPGKDAFELYDTYGFPLDLTELILRENSLNVNIDEFKVEMENQKNRSRHAANIDTEDWILLNDEDFNTFIGYDNLDAIVRISKYRKIRDKGKSFYQLVFNLTPFYAESGGQVGDTGIIENENEKIEILDTKKENNLTIHITDKLPDNPDAEFSAIVNFEKRIATANNHTATHLLHNALRKVLGNHVEQKGSLVHPEYLRFDFSHYQKVSDEELKEIESLVNSSIRKNNLLEEHRSLSLKEANAMGAIALFGEKYSETVRLIKFGESMELCGGTHVQATGQIGYFKILSESAISAGVRRIEAITADKAEEYINRQLEVLGDIKKLINNPKNPVDSIRNLLEEHNKFSKAIAILAKERIKTIKENLKKEIINQSGIHVIAARIDLDSMDLIKELAFQLKNEIENLVLILGAETGGKAGIAVMISENLVKEKNLNAAAIIKEAAKEIEGGGGGQPFFATAGGKNIEGIDKAIEKARYFIL